MVELIRFTAYDAIDELSLPLIIYLYLIDILIIIESVSVVDIANKLSSMCTTDILWSPHIATLISFLLYEIIVAEQYFNGK